MCGLASKSGPRLLNPSLRFCDFPLGSGGDVCVSIDIGDAKEILGRVSTFVSQIAIGLGERLR